ncbi:MAG: hypothetical protein KIT62_04980 [Cyclobacteriaceae bacterium]|nr:hypothetical protein [Cyclobacteriaceae bacterium]
MNFEEYLIGKRIDEVAFRAAEPVLWKEWNNLFDQVSPTSFTAQKLYLINPIRRKYPLKVAEAETAPKPAVAAKPVMKPKPKIS